MGQMSVHSNPPIIVSYAQPTPAPTQTSDVHAVQTVNNQQPGGNKKKKNKKGNNSGQGATTTDNNNNTIAGGKKTRIK